jgi:hypothetical protein
MQLTGSLLAPLTYLTGSLLAFAHYWYLSHITAHITAHLYWPIFAQLLIEPNR